MTRLRTRIKNLRMDDGACIVQKPRAEHCALVLEDMAIVWQGRRQLVSVSGYLCLG